MSREVSRMEAVFSRVGPSTIAVLKLAGGSTAAQLIGIAVTPLLTRIYDPAELGALAAFLALSALFTVASTARYEQALMLPEEERVAVELAILAVALSLVAAATTLCSVLVVVPLLSSSNSQESFVWLYFLPLMVLIASVNSVLVAFTTRLKRFNVVSTTIVIRATVQALLQLALGSWQPTSTSLVASTTVGAGSANFRLTKACYGSLKKHRSTISVHSILRSGRDFSGFPRHTLPANLLAVASVALLPIFIGISFGATTLGLWALAQRLVLLPLSLIGSSVAQVYYRRAAEVRHQGGDSFALFVGSAKKLALFSLLPFAALAIFAPWIIGTVFGPEWAEAGDYSRIMIPWLWASFVANPLAQTLLVFRRNRLDFLVRSAILVVLGVAAALSVVLSWDFATFLLLFSFASAISYAGILLLCGWVIHVDGSDERAK